MTRERRSFRLPSPCGANELNALRRALLTDLPTLAPSHCVFRTNTSCVSDEFIAHRIGLVPFEQTFEIVGRTCSLKVSGIDATTGHITGDGPHPIFCDALVVPLTESQELDLDIHFTIGRGADHARFCRIVAPSIRTETREIEFEDIFGNAERCIALARDALIARIDRAIESIESIESPEGKIEPTTTS